MHIETLRKHRKSLIKARRDIKAKLELLDTLLRQEEAAGVPRRPPPPLVPEPPAAWCWDAAKAYQTAARNAFRNADANTPPTAPEMLPMIHDYDDGGRANQTAERATERGSWPLATEASS